MGKGWKGLSGRYKYYIHVWIENQENDDSRFKISGFGMENFVYGIFPYNERWGVILCCFLPLLFLVLNRLPSLDGIGLDWQSIGGSRGGTISRELEM